MGWLERSAIAALLVASCAHADAPAYGKVETFQPGKKYNCVPTPDHKAWDCSESGKAAQSPARQSASTPPPAASQPPESEPKASALPGYLMNPAVNGRPRSARAPAAETTPAAPRVAAQAPAEKTPVVPARPTSAASAEKSPAPPPQAEPLPNAPAPSRAASAEKSPAPPPQAEPPPPTTAAQPAAKPPAVARGSTPPVPPADNEFANLPGDQYVLELAHADSAAVEVPAVARGKVYKLHLRQNGAERWLLLWGPFDNIESARAARDEIAAQGITPGWPRRVAPLQAEVRRATE